MSASYIYHQKKKNNLKDLSVLKEFVFSTFLFSIFFCSIFKNNVDHLTIFFKMCERVPYYQSKEKYNSFYIQH